MIQINNINFSKKTIESIQIDNDDVKGVEVELQKTNFKITIIKNSNETIKEERNNIDYRYEEPKDEEPEPEPEHEPEPEPELEPEPEPEPSPTIVEYRVQSGDTLSRIASKFGISSSALQSFNSISNPNRISVGQLLKIPTSTENTNVAQAQESEKPEAPTTYTVVSGDTLWGISRKFGASSSALASLNGINNSNFIRVGQVLKIPN